MRTMSALGMGVVLVCLAFVAMPVASAGGVYTCTSWSSTNGGPWECGNRIQILGSDAYQGEICIPQIVNGKPC